MKSLVIYFSHTGENYVNGGVKNIDKGNTEVVAEIIKKLTNADLFRIEPVSEYPREYDKCCDVAKEELDKNARPGVKKTLNSLDGYDVIYVGGPVWWGHFPCVVDTVLEKLDFTGKIVKPFTTHEGSGLGNVMSDIKRYVKDATLGDGLAIVGSHVYESEDLIKKWIGDR